MPSATWGSLQPHFRTLSRCSRGRTVTPRIYRRQEVFAVKGMDGARETSALPEPSRGTRAGQPAQAPRRQPRAHFRLFPGPLVSGRFVTAFLKCQSSCPLKLLHKCRPDGPLKQGGRPAEEHGDRRAHQGPALLSGASPPPAAPVPSAPRGAAEAAQHLLQEKCQQLPC